MTGSGTCRATVTWAATTSRCTSMTWTPPWSTCGPRACGCWPGRSPAGTPRRGSGGSTSCLPGACSSSWSATPAARPTSRARRCGYGIPGTRPSERAGNAVSEAVASVASHRIAGELRAAILDGRYPPGTRIRQEDLAAQAGASRIPVREALRELAAEGLVTLVANSGAWVTRLTMEQCAEAYLVRERLEPLLLRLSLPGLDGAVIARLAELAGEMEQAPDVAAFLRADREFHLAGYAGAPRGEAWGIISRLWNATQHYR